jgi:FkbM family methyltransferase
MSDRSFLTRGNVLVTLPDDLSLLTPYILAEQRDWFEHEIAFVRALVTAGMNTVDVGANYGIYTLTMARASGPDGQVWAFEPASKTADYLARSIVANGFGNVHLVKAGLSDTRRRAVLSTLENSELNHVGPASGDGEPIVLTTLDAFAAEIRDRKIDFVKLDAEGEELNIIAGGLRFLERNAPVVMFEIKNGSTANLKIAERFAELGFSIHRLAPGLNALVPFESDRPLDAFQLNLFAAGPGRAAELAARGLLARTVMAPPPAGSRWRTELGAQIWARALLPAWRDSGMTSQDAGRRDHEAALDAFFASRDAGLSIDARAGHLAYAHAAARRAVTEQASLPRLLTCARIALAYGFRMEAIADLARAVDLLRAGGTFALDEPFLSPHERHETVPAAGRVKAWILAATIEAYEAASAYSSYFNPGRSAALLEQIDRNPCLTIEGARRIDMSRTRGGDATGAARRHPARVDTLLPALETPIAIADIGARPSQGGEDYRAVIERGIARVIGFEPDQASIGETTRRHRWSVYYPDFIGDGRARPFHVTNRPMTASLFRPDRTIVDRFNNLGELLQVVDTPTVQTRRLDDAVPDDVDMIKIDIQGGELMAFEGGARVLSRTMLIQTEISFVPIYEGQPLFAEIDQCLRRHGFLFHGLAGVAGRAFKPLVVNGNPNQPFRQMLWADALYVKDFRGLDAFSDQKLAKLAILLDEVYGSCDLAWQVLTILDARHGTRTAAAYATLLAGRGQAARSPALNPSRPA